MSRGELTFYQSDNGEWRWRITANNGRIIAESSEGYENKTDCEDGAVIAAEVLGEWYGSL